MSARDDYPILAVLIWHPLDYTDTALECARQ